MGKASTRASASSTVRTSSTETPTPIARISASVSAASTGTGRVSVSSSVSSGAGIPVARRWCRQPLGEACLGELRGCDVHGDLDAAAATHERSTVTAGSLEHHIADGDHRPGRLSEGDELARWDDPALGVAPAAQRLEGDEESVAQVDLRLVLRDDLAPLDGEAQIACEPLVV